MSHLFFIDESGHDHKNAPYEVRGGVAIPVGKLWPFIRGFRDSELSCYGAALADFKTEVKGHKLLDKKRFEWAKQGDPMPDDERRKLCRQFLEKGQRKMQQIRPEFTAYGQACLRMVSNVFELLIAHDAQLFASVIPCGVTPPDHFPEQNFLRKDQVFLFERFFYFLEAKRTHGLIVMDESDKDLDRHFVRRLHAYFDNTQTGRQRTAWIVPAPMFVASDMAFPVQAADLCIYAINHCYRFGDMTGPVRPELAELCLEYLQQLVWHGEGYNARENKVFKTHGIVYVPDLYNERGR